VDFGKGSSVRLTNEGKLSSGGVSPTWTVSIVHFVSQLEYIPQTSFVTNTGSAAHVLVTKESLHIDIAARVTPGLSIDTSCRRGNLVTVLVEDTRGSLLLEEGSLALAQNTHANGIGGGVSTEVTLIELGRVDLVLSNGRASQGSKEEGGERGLHFDDATTNVDEK